MVSPRTSIRPFGWFGSSLEQLERRAAPTTILQIAPPERALEETIFTRWDRLMKTIAEKADAFLPRKKVPRLLALIVMVCIGAIQVK